MVCKARVDGLEPETAYTYQISYDGGASWLGGYAYTTAGTDGFRFGFTSDPQIKEDQSNDDQGWNPADGTNQTGWASMMEKADGRRREPCRVSGRPGGGPELGEIERVRGVLCPGRDGLGRICAGSGKP